mgnify:CR=1 FL=1
MGRPARLCRGIPIETVAVRGSRMEVFLFAPQGAGPYHVVLSGQVGYNFRKNPEDPVVVHVPHAGLQIPDDVRAPAAIGAKLCAIWHSDLKAESLRAVL